MKILQSISKTRNKSLTISKHYSVSWCAVTSIWRVKHEWGFPQNVAWSWHSAAEQGAFGCFSTCFHCCLLSSTHLHTRWEFRQRLSRVNKAGISNSQGIVQLCLYPPDSDTHWGTHTNTLSKTKIQFTTLKLIRVWNSRYWFVKSH